LWSSDVIHEPSNSLCIIAFGDVDDLPGVDVDEQRNIVLAALGHLIDGDAPQVSKVHVCHGRLDVVLNDTPQTRVVLPDQAGDWSDRYVRDEGHVERLEQKREAGTGPRPRHVETRN
jgi:hypothetical protein